MRQVAGLPFSMDVVPAEVPSDENKTMACEKTSDQRLPVTLLSGFLGAGKTTLLKHVLQNQDGLRVAIIVNDMAEVNIDAMLIKSGAKRVSGIDKMVEMQNGCICCTLKEDFIENVRQLCAEKRFDYILIESTGISEPMPVATAFAHEHDGKKLLGDITRLDTLVTVIDALNFMKDYCQGQRLADRKALGAEQEDPRTIAHLLVDQVECANLILLNKTDLVTEREANKLEMMIEKMNPKAKIIRSSFSKVDLKHLLNTSSFDMDEAKQMPGWLQEMQGNHVPETLEYGISSFVFRSQRPFHPERLDNLLSGGLQGVFRSKGMLWIAGVHSVSLMWSQAGQNAGIDAGAPWFHGSANVSEWPADIREEFGKAPYGDRRQQLVFIGKSLDEAQLRQRLEDALVTDYEYKGGILMWAKWPNPFLSFQHEHQHQQVHKGQMKQKESTKKQKRRSQAKTFMKSVAVRKQPAASNKKWKLALLVLKRKASHQTEVHKKLSKTVS